MLDIVCCTMGSQLVILLLQISISYSTPDSVLEMIDVGFNDSCALNTNCSCIETVNTNFSEVMKNDNQPNATLNVNKVNQHNATLTINATVHNQHFNTLTQTINQIQGNENKLQNFFIDNWSINESSSTKPAGDLFRVSNNVHDLKPMDVQRVAKDDGHLTTAIKAEDVEMQCFGCNGEFMLVEWEQNPKFMSPERFKTIISLTPNVFKLVPFFDISLTVWTTSQCVKHSNLCHICNEYNWFENRPDGVCRRLYIYNIAMSVYDITDDFYDLNKMSYFIMCYLKHNFGFDVLEEWWPPLVVFDGRLETHLYVARFLVYDVHRASIKDAVNQIRQLSLVTYMLRYHFKSLLDQANQSISMQYMRVESFDLGGRMRKVLEHYNITEVTNRSTCICKAVYGAALQIRISLDMINSDCNLGCFFETFDKVERNLSQHLGFACLHFYNNCGYNVLNPLLNFIFIINVLLH